MKVFVHGNPETSAIWQPLFTELEQAGQSRSELICLSPPGFGAPLPAGFGATVTEYRDWLAGELAQFDQPVDLVGHDWGGGHVMNVVMSRPTLVRSWVVDVIGLFDRDYVWHDMAQLWQTPGVGEKAVAKMVDGDIQDRIAALHAGGMTVPVAEQVVLGQNEAMGEAVLALYRSAAQPVVAELGKNLETAAQRPGLALNATEDPFVGTEEQRHRAARRAGARMETLRGLGHWWMTQDPSHAASILTNWWASLER
ncbi:alpha/beta fold hydrolase [Nocardia callitridis]|uniref:Alpha/beta fold hydrolase n=1 Tax=Nocardia callitridis TaxID=648753 RepID=A0ABP9KTV3_9NOCA